MFLGAGGDYTTIYQVKGAVRWGTNVTSKLGGQDAIPVALRLGTDGNSRRTLETFASNGLINASVIQGDRWTCATRKSAPARTNTAPKMLTRAIVFVLR